MRHGLAVRATALVMSWVLTATTVWAAAPRVAPPPVVNVPLPSVYPHLPSPLLAQHPGRVGRGFEASEAVAAREASAFGTEPAAFAPEASAFAPEPMTEPSPSPAPGGNVGIFGPQRYVRTTGPKNVYTTTVLVPAWVASPFTMHIQNGEPNGTYRVSSAWIEVNGTQIAGPSDFNLNVPGFDRTVTLTPQTTLKVTLASKPTSYLTINLGGGNADHTAPEVTIETPVAQSIVNDPRPRLAVKFRDVKGPGEPAASGVDTSTLKVTLDGVDRTSLFTRRCDEATAEIPAALALAAGPHVLVATIKDVAGNQGQASTDFRVDLTKPTIEVVEPTEGSYLPTLRPTIRMRYADDVAVDLSRLSIKIDGADRTHDFSVGAAEATATLDLAAGPRQVTATIKDKAGNAADTSRGFRLDVAVPTLSIDQPLAGSRHGLPDVEVLIHYHDDQSLDLATFKASVDGNPIVLAKGPEGASGTVHLGDAPQHILAAEIKDRAGNLRNASNTFSVDTGAPFVRVVQPPPGQIIATATPHVSVEYSDPQGIQATTFKLWAGPPGARVDRTSWCVAAAGGAECTIQPADRLPEGDNVITGEVKDLTGNLGTADSRFKVDTIKPTGSLTAPPNPTNVARPTITFAYDDGAGTGIDTGSVHVFVGGVDRTDRFLPGAAGVTGALPEALTEGEHPVRLEMADLAGNPATVQGAFVVDTLAPSGSFTKPADNTFINDATPDLEVGYADAEGTGVVPAQVKVFLQRGSDEWVDVTSYFQRGSDRATGVVPASAPLADGTYHLRAEIQDAAGNAATIQASFQVDAVAPHYTIQTPANDAHLPTRTPPFLVTYADDPSGVGVNATTVTLLVDGIDVTAQLPAATATELAGTLAQPLAEGEHTAAVKVFDRAGNQAVIAPHVFTVDTVPPVAALESPHDGDYLGSSAQVVRFTYADPNGDAPDGTIDPASVKVTVDGVDRTADFTPNESQAEATLTLAHGSHTVHVELVDWASNPGASGGTFFIDLQPPVVHIQSPAEGSFLRQTPVIVTGTLMDDDPTTTVECQGAGDPVPATVNGGTFTCAVPLAERGNVVKATAKDRLGRTGLDSRNVTLDSIAPAITILQPPTGVATAGATIEVLGQVHDESAVAVVVGTTPAEVQGDSFRAVVPLGLGPVEHIVATATDAAGNTSETSTDVTIDRLAPVVKITSPVQDAYLKGPTIDVHGTVSDASSVSVEINQQPAPVSGPSMDATFSAVVPVVDGRTEIKATAHDAAANTGADEVWINVDSVPPAIVITAPAPGTITRAASIHVAGTVADASPFTLKIEGQVVPVVDGTFAVDVPLPSEGSREITADAIDAAGNEGIVRVTVIVDRTPPALDFVSPVEGAVLGALPVSVVGTVSDASPTTVIVDTQPATRTGQAWQAAVGGLPEGGHTFTVIATDAAGNETIVYRAVTIDLSAPIVHIITPADGTVTRDGTVTVTGEVEDRSAVTVVVDAGGPGQPAVVTGTGPFTFTALLALADGDNTITATATDQTAQPGSAHVRVTRDSIAPTIELVTPAKISRGRPGQATVVVTDNLALGAFTVKVDGSPVGSFTSASAVVPLSVPAGKVAGDSFQVSVEAADAAGNTATAQRDVRVISDGVIVGQVLVDTTGLPLPGATAHMTTTSGVEAATTDDRGRYSFPTGDVAAVLSIEKTGMTTVERELTIESGTGTIPVDARLTSLADARAIVPDGGSLTVGTLTLTVGAGAGGTYRFTPLSAQGLPALLPMGWSPLAAFHLSTPADGGVLSASATGLPALATYLVEYRLAIHDWSLVASTGTPADGALTFAVPGSGSFAIVAPDDDTILIPAAGDVIAGVPFELLPATATSKSVVTPATLPPSGGTARGALQVISPTALPSGTVLQAQVKETFTLSSGEVASEEQRRQDIVLFAHPAPAEAALAAEIPLTPSRTFTTTELVEGKVHLDILAGREGVRGKTGGLEAVQLDSGDVRLGLAKQSLADDTAVAVEQTVLSPFLPSSPSLVPLGETVVDFAGQRLSFAAELSLADPGVVSPGDTLLVARVERVDGIPRMVVVALAELSGGRVRTIPTPPLPGLREEGRYVFYRSAVPIGFVSGLVTPVAGRALVEMVGPGATPFVALTTADGHYLLAVAAGQVTVRARLLKTALAGQAQAAVDAGQAAVLDIALIGSVTTATVSPASGALVAPNRQLTLAADTALDPSKITAANIRLTKTGSVVAIDLRFVLSGSGKTLTIVPTPPAGSPENAVALTFSTDYTFEATGLKTVLGGDVLVPTVNFRTKDDTPPVYNTSALTFSFPDADGNITITAPAGSFPPGSQILVLNSGNGDVATFTADNDGAVGVLVPATIRGSINDRLIVSITDPQGNVTAFNRSQFVDPATGNTAIGSGGGVVEGAGGVELRIPDGALDKGVTLKIKGVTAGELAQQFPNQNPDFPGATLGSGLRIDSDDKPAFKKEVDLAFPVPATALQAVQAADKKIEDAFFYVYRRIELPNGKAAFEAIDHAFVECPPGKTTCPAEEQRVVTASYPFSGYLTSLGGMQASGALFATASNYAFLMWTFDIAFAAKPLAGAITGTVRRTTWDPGATTPQYVPIAGATVSGVDAAGVPLLLASNNATIAVARQDGGYTLWDRQYSGGPITITATLPGQGVQSPCPQPETSPTRCATGFEANPADWSTSGLRFYQNIASVNATFPPLQPPPPPAEIQIRVMRLVSGKRTDTGGLVVANTPLVIGLTAKNGDVRGGSINGQDYGVRVDPLRGADPLGMDFVLDPDFTPTHPGSFTVTATALPAFGSAVTSSFTFRVVAEGGGVDTLPNEPPKVITAKVVPKANAQGVPVTVFPQVAFTEPVRNVPGNVRLADSAGNEVALKLSGISPTGAVVDDVTSADERVTSLTIQPLVGLRYATTYRLTLRDGIQDLDKDAQGDPAPKSLAAFETSFTTFGPVALTEPGTGETFTSPGIVVLGERAYLVQNNFFNGTLRAFDVSDPVSPREIESARALVTWRPVDITGEEETTISQGRLIAVATSSTNQSKPSNVYIFDTTSDLATRWIGAVSLANSAIEGFINRIASRDGFLYAATAKKGIQVVDLGQAKSVFEPPGSPDYWRMVQAFNTDGQGFGQQAVVQTIPVNDASGRALMMRDLKVGDFVVDSQPQPLVVASGDAPLVVVNPQMGGILARPALETANGSKLTWGQALALGTINDTRIAVVVGAGTTAAGANTVLAVVSLNDPRFPQVMSILAITGITGSPTDVLLKGTLALVGTTKEVALVSLQDLSQPTMAGVLQNVAGRLALTSSNLLLSSARSVFGGNDPLGGVRTAALDNLAYFRRISPEPFRLAQGKNADPVVMEIGLVPATYEVAVAEVDLFMQGTKIATLPATFSSLGKAVLQPGFVFNPTALYEAQTVINRGQQGKELISTKKALRPADVEFIWSKEVEVTENGQTKLLDIIKQYDARPRVVLDPTSPDSGLRTTIKGRVIDDLAPVKTLLVNGLEVPISQLPPAANAITEEVGPFEGTFTLPVSETINTPFYSPTPDNAVKYGYDGTLAAATATNALKNVGWDGVWLNPNPNPDGKMPNTGTQGLGIIEQETVPSPAVRTDYQFRISVNDRGLPPGATWLLARVKTTVEEKLVRLERVATYFVSRPLYLVPETFEMPDGLSPQVVGLIRNTRIRGKLGTRISVSYVTDDIKDDGIVAGIELVDEDQPDQPLKFIPAALAQPAVTIATMEGFLSPESFGLRWEARATGVVRDPIAAVFSAARPVVTMGGQLAALTSTAEPGVFNFTVSGARLLPEGRVYVRAESANGAIGYASRRVTLVPATNPTQAIVDPGPPITIAPDALRAVKVKVYGPDLGAASVTGDVRGAYSIPLGSGVGHWDGQLPPTVPLSFKDTNAPRADGVHVYLSEGKVLPVKVPSHQFRQPTTPGTIAAQPLLAVEVGGFADVRLNLGAAGALRGLTDVSGLDMLVPREGGIVNVTQSLIPTNPQFTEFVPVMNVTLRWRGINSAPSVLRASVDADVMVSDLSSVFASARRDSTIITVPVTGELGLNVFSGNGIDTAGRSHRAEAGVFALVEQMVANEDAISPFSADDVAGMALGQGRYYVPDLYDGFDLLYPPGLGDLEITDHLRKNGLRVVALKRNLGNLVTVSRIDGKSALTEPLAVEVPDVPVPSRAGTLPIDEQLMDHDQVTWNDIKNAHKDEEWLNSYRAGPLEPQWPDVAERSAIIQEVRTRLGLAPRTLGMSIEYQGYIKGILKEIGINVLLAVMFDLPSILRLLLESFDRFFVLLIERSLTEGRIVEVLMRNGAVRVPIILPALEDTVEFAAPSATQQAAIGIAAIRNQAARDLAKAAYGSAAKKAAYNRMLGASMDLGDLGLIDYIAARFGPGTVICCAGMPKSGGGATGVFDAVAEIVLKDAAGNQIGTRVYIGEAKGGIEWFDIMARQQGRLMTLEGRGQVYALRGTREYVEGTALEMVKPDRPANVRAAGQKILDKINQGRWSEIEYEFVSSQWIQQGRRVTGMSPIVQLTKAILGP